MAAITLEKLRYKNFLSTGDTFTEIDLTKTQTTLIVGPNGSGKSSALDALSYVLFGKAHRNINKAQLINSVNEKGLLVEIEFKTESNYKVVRGMKPNVFQIWKEGVLINENSHAKKYQKLLEQNIVRHNHKSFHQIEVLGSSSHVPFMQLPAWVRREVIEDLLDINIFSRMNLLQKEKNATLKDLIADNAHDIELVKTKIESQRKHMKEIEKLADTVIDSKTREITDLLEEIEDLQSSIGDIDLGALDGLRTQSATLGKKIDQMKAYESDFTSKCRKLTKSMAFFDDNDNCPTCEQDIDQEFKTTKNEESAEKYRKFQEGITRASEEIANLVARADAITEQIESELVKSAKIESSQSSIRTHQRRVSVLESELLSLRESNDSIDTARDILDSLMAQSTELTTVRHQLLEQKEYNQVIGELLKDTGIKTKIIKQYLPVINKFVNQYLQVLDFYVHFELDESFKETIKSRHRDAFSYDSFSEGEKQRIDLALLFTWRQIAKMKNSVSTNMLILDETFDSSLDADGVENLLKILETLNESTNVFVISHKQELMQDKFDRTLEFTKQNNFSTYGEVS